MKYIQMYDVLLERQVLEEDANLLNKKLAREGQTYNASFMAKTQNAALKMENERLKAQLPIKLKSMRRIDATIEELKNCVLREYMHF